MSIASVLADVFRSGRKIDEIASEEKAQERAVVVAARFARGNVNGQYRRLLTDRFLQKRLDEYATRHQSKSFFFSKPK